MAICRSGARFDKDSYYETIVDESNEDVMVRGTKNGEPVEYSLGGDGGSSDILIVGITISMSESDGLVVSNIDKTYDEIKAAFEGGKCVVANASTEVEGVLFSMATIANCSCRVSSRGNISFTIWGHNTSGTTLASVNVIEILLLYDGSVSVQSYEGELHTV